MDMQKRKKYYSNFNNNQKKRKQLFMEPGMTGFLCTCNYREKDCVRDAYKILNEFADELYGSTKKPGPDKSEKDEKAENSTQQEKQDVEDDDISTALAKEINELKAESQTPFPRFQVVDTGVKNVVFIKSTLENPLELASKIIQELDKTKQLRTRFLLRLLPIHLICKANMNDIKTKANALLENYFAQEPKTFCIIFNRHSNNAIQKTEVIEDLAEIVSRKNPGNKADLKNPEIAVVVEVIRGLCLISIAPEYYKYKKYNLHEICNVKDDKKSAKDDTSKETEDIDKSTNASESSSNIEKPDDPDAEKVSEPNENTDTGVSEETEGEEKNDL